MIIDNSTVENNAFDLTLLNGKKAFKSCFLLPQIFVDSKFLNDPLFFIWK